MKKKIGIITFHFPHNVGAVLQCYALQTKLEQLGYDVVVVDYRPEYHTNMYKPLRNPIRESLDFIRSHKIEGKVNKIYRFTRHCGSILRSNLRFRIIKKRQIVFTHFIEEYLHLTRNYSTIEALRKAPPDVDVLISGSDQLWNTDVTNGQIDRAYFLDFGNKKTRRITYAVSVDIKDSELDAAIKLMKKIDAISVREKDSMNTIVTRDSSIPICIQPDPTLLIEKTRYDDIADEEDFGDYVLFYGLRTADRKPLLELMNKVKDELKLNVVDISPVGWSIKSSLRKTVISPSEFIGLIRGAKCVVTNSFHGTVFSCIYNVPFWVVAPSLKSSRIVNLLIQLGIEDRIINLESINSIDVKRPIDYDRVNAVLSELREEGKRYLISNCSGSE